MFFDTACVACLNARNEMGNGFVFHVVCFNNISCWKGFCEIFLFLRIDQIQTCGLINDIPVVF